MLEYSSTPVQARFNKVYSIRSRPGSSLLLLPPNKQKVTSSSPRGGGGGAQSVLLMVTVLSQKLVIAMPSALKGKKEVKGI